MSLQRLAGVSRAQLQIEAVQRAHLHALLGPWLAALLTSASQYAGISKSIRPELLTT